MVILPFARPKWHISGLGLFALGSFWMGYWGWYSVTGLIFADLAINATLKAELKAGLKVRDDWRIPYAAIAPMLFAVGIAFKYAFIVRPQYMDKLLVLHPYLDISTRYSPSTTVEAGPYARLDDWFVITGILLAVELFENAQYYLSFKPLVYVGERSFSTYQTVLGAAVCLTNFTHRHFRRAVYILLDRRHKALATPPRRERFSHSKCQWCCFPCGFPGCVCVCRSFLSTDRCTFNLVGQEDLHMAGGLTSKCVSEKRGQARWPALWF